MVSQAKKEHLGQNMAYAVDLNNLASLLCNHTRYPEAIELYEELIALTSALQGPDDVAVGFAQ